MYFFRPCLSYLACAQPPAHRFCNESSWRPCIGYSNTELPTGDSLDPTHSTQQTAKVIGRRTCYDDHKEMNILFQLSQKGKQSDFRKSETVLFGSFLTIFEIWPDMKNVCLNFPFLLKPHKKNDTAKHTIKKGTLFSIYSLIRCD